MTTKKTDTKMGRKPWTLSPAKLKKIFEGAKAGQTEEWIARSIGIHQSTFVEKKKRFPKISEAIKKGRDECLVNDLQLAERTLMKRVLGYRYKELEVKEKPSKDGVVKIRKVTVKHVPPSDASLFFFLCNRAPERWQSLNKKEAEAPENIQESLSRLADAVMQRDSGGSRYEDNHD